MRKFLLNSEQKNNLLAEIQEVGRRLLDINFDKPEQDNLNIRHHAYLRGKFDAMQAIFNDDYQDPEPQPIEGA